LSSAFRHLDRSSYWRSEYERVKTGLQSAENENVLLQKEVDQLKQRLQAARPSSPKKRKKPDEDVIPVPKSPKKTRSAPELTKATSDVLAVDLDFDIASDDVVGECSIIGLSLAET
jgi:hypothetical protein